MPLIELCIFVVVLICTTQACNITLNSKPWFCQPLNLSGVSVTITDNIETVKCNYINSYTNLTLGNFVFDCVGEGILYKVIKVCEGNVSTTANVFNVTEIKSDGTQVESSLCIDVKGNNTKTADFIKMIGVIIGVVAFFIVVIVIVVFLIRRAGLQVKEKEEKDPLNETQLTTACNGENL